ncbi:MAG: phosphate acyltransferase PlsX [Phycisphaerae bacterium]|nr:phosphate acyltransferase PlsX [Phycisphaerae bacterium]
MRIGLDVMGGDRGPEEVIAGALEACALLEADDRVVLVGDQAVIEDKLSQAGGENRKIEIHHAPDVIGMAESPVDALRTKPKSSIALLASLHKSGELNACISAGNTGACVAAAQMRLGRLAGVHRPGIAIVAPTTAGPVAICDVGANVNCRPLHLYQYGVMTSLYIKAVTDIETPRVALLSVGEEEGKGNELVRKTAELMKADSFLNFIGNVEGRDLVSGACDVMVCEGFVGNVVLKLVEGIGEGLMRGLMKKFAAAMPDQMERIMQIAAGMREQYDFNMYGGAPLLGVAGIWIICHGASSSVGIANAIREAKAFSAHKVNQHIIEQLSESRD